MQFKVIPFTAHMERNDTSAKVASQMQTIIDDHVLQGWEYIRMDSVQTFIAADEGCFGIGAKPGFYTTYNVLVFKNNI